jgi:hypothetical protein
MNMRRYFYPLLSLIFCIAFANASSAEGDDSFNSCIAHLSKIAKSQTKPFEVSAYSLFNKKLPSKRIKTLFDVMREGKRDSYGNYLSNVKELQKNFVSNNIGNITLPQNCFKGVKNIDHNKMYPLVVMKYGDRYYTQLLHTYSIESDSIGDVLAIGLVIHDNITKKISYIPKVSVWFGFEGVEFLANAEVQHSDIFVRASIFSPKKQGKSGNVLEYKTYKHNVFVGQYTIEKSGDITEFLKYGSIDRLLML